MTVSVAESLPGEYLVAGSGDCAFSAVMNVAEYLGSAVRKPLFIDELLLSILGSLILCVTVILDSFDRYPNSTGYQVPEVTL
jgi:hypothetical protein